MSLIVLLLRGFKLLNNKIILTSILAQNEPCREFVENKKIKWKNLLKQLSIFKVKREEKKLKILSRVFKNFNNFRALCPFFIPSSAAIVIVVHFYYGYTYTCAANDIKLKKTAMEWKKYVYRIPQGAYSSGFTCFISTISL